MNLSKPAFIIFTCLLVCLLTRGVHAQAQPIIIQEQVDSSKAIPIAISGFSPEVESVLRFDLEVMGFEIVNGEQARFFVEGRSNAPVEGVVTDRAKTVLLANRYSGGSTRAQTHALSDDIAQRITGFPGIARTRIAFRGQQGNATEIFVADYDGFNAVPVTRDGSLVAAPAWVPGKNQLFYTSYRSGYPDIYFQDLSSGNRRVIAKYPGLNTSAAVSSDGTRLAMILSKGGSPDLFVADIDGTNLRQLTKTKEDESSPCWSPDGKTICVVSAVSGRPALYLVAAAGGDMRRLSTAGALTVTEPDWSPDGKWISFTALRGRQFWICVVPAGGGDTVFLAEGEDPSWAPNSRTIIFSRTDGNRRRILSLLDVPTKRVKDVLQNSGNWSQPSWAK
jgi:TolB protein